jgi:hypothetical protein
LATQNAGATELVGVPDGIGFKDEVEFLAWARGRRAGEQAEREAVGRPPAQLIH